MKKLVLGSKAANEEQNARLEGERKLMFRLIYSNSSIALLVCVLGFLWFTLVNQLRVEWSVNPSYSYGWVVPILCIGLLLRRWQASSELSGLVSETRPPSSELRNLAVLFVLMAFLWLPTRLVQEANPEWRMISWALAVEVVTLTMLAIRLAVGSSWALWVAFPICFFLVAVPWPTPIEAPLIQSLTRLNSAITVEVLGWMGIPAMQQGNLITVSGGTVGVDEACSGIRSFQTSLMISLFFGEFYRMNSLRRLLLVPLGFMLAMAFNICRMSFLTTIAARKGVAAIGEYHDPAGITITLVCTAGLWGLAVLFKKREGITKQKLETKSQKTESAVKKAEIGSQNSEGPPRISEFQLFNFSLALLAWIVLVEVGVESWYRWHEARLPKSSLWSIEWPRKNPTFSQAAIGEKATRLLRYDEGTSGAWLEADGTQWQMTYFRWLPGRIAVHLAKTHTPDVCLPAAGYTVETLPDITYLTVQGLSLPFREYILNREGVPAYVFYCLWEDRAREQSFQRTQLTYANRLDPVLQGRRNVGQRSLEIVVRGVSDLQNAQAAVQRQLEKLIKLENPTLSKAKMLKS